MRTVNWVGCVLATGLAGCSLYPLPDDVSPFSTQRIVRYGRCEVKEAVRAHMMGRGFITEQMTTKQIGDLIKTKKRKEKDHPKDLHPLEIEFLRLMKVAIVYSFDFNITENNKASAGVGFRLPTGTANTLDVNGAGAVDLTRVGSRVFGTEDSWDELVVNDELCAEPYQRGGNFLYPLTGSIGVGRVVETFIDIDLQGGAKDNFVDTLTFTTNVSGGADAALRLEPIPHRFAPVSAAAASSASRVDIHKLTVSLAFPQPAPADPNAAFRLSAGDQSGSPFERPAAWRARYNLCVQDARTREASFKQLRLTDPVVYCISYADEFAPKYGREGQKTVVQKTITTPKQKLGATSGAPEAAVAAPGAAAATTETITTTTTTTPGVRPNRPLSPLY